jgi:hypothetical protein
MRSLLPTSEPTCHPLKPHRLNAAAGCSVATQVVVARFWRQLNPMVHFNRIGPQSVPEPDPLLGPLDSEYQAMLQDRMDQVSGGDCWDLWVMLQDRMDQVSGGDCWDLWVMLQDRMDQVSAGDCWDLWVMLQDRMDQVR